MRYIFVLALFLLFSCRGIQNDKQLLHEAELLSDSVPGEALAKLQAVKNGQRLPDADRAKYNLLLTRAWLDTGTRPPSDSLINVAIRIYRQRNDSTQLFEAIYTKGRYLYSISKHDSALHYFSQAETCIPSSENNGRRVRTQRISGFSQLYLGNVDEAVGHLEKVLDITLERADTLSSVYAMMNLAMAQTYDKDVEPAIRTYQRAMQWAQAINERNLQSAIFNQLSGLYARQNDFKNALEYKKQEHNLRINRKEIPSRNLAQAMFFDKMNNPDSTRHYLELAIQGSDNVVADIAYGFLSDWHANRGSYDEAFAAWRKKDETTRHLESNISTALLQHEYEREKLRNENNELKIRQKEKDIILLVILLSVVATVGVLFFIFWQQKKKRQAFLLQTRAKQLEQENQLLKQQSEISALREKESLLRESLFRRIHLFDKIPSLHQEEVAGDGNSTLSYPKIKMTDNDWDELTQSVNEAYPGFTGRLENDFPKLNDDDIRFCCFLKINVSLQDLSDIYCVSKSAITKRKYRIKTEKLHLQDSTMDLDTFLQTNY